MSPLQFLEEGWDVAKAIPQSDRSRFLTEKTEAPKTQTPTPPPVQREKKTYTRSEEDKGKLIGNSSVDCNVLLPLHYPQFRDLWRRGMDNNWLPTTVPMLKDKQTWQRSPDDPEGLTLDERHVVLTNLSFFSPSESLIGNHIGLALMKYINDPGARQALWRLGFEESIHNETFMYIVESLGLNEKEIYSAYHTVPVIQAKTSFMQEATESLANERIDTNTIEGKRTFIEALLAQMIMEGILFYSGFVMILNLHKQNKMTGIGKQYAYIMRDESVHIEIVRTIFNILTKEEWPEVWTEDLQNLCYQKIKEAVELEIAYARYCLPNGIMGLKADMFVDYVQYLADRRLEFIGLKKIYNSTNPFPWLEEVVDLKEQANFFEGRVTEYQSRPLEF